LPAASAPASRRSCARWSTTRNTTSRSRWSRRAAFSPTCCASLLDELDALIEEYGPTALAVDFAQVHASEPLTRAIEAVINDENRENPPTLSVIEDDTLLWEIEALIEHFGGDTLAEDFLRYE